MSFTFLDTEKNYGLAAETVWIRGERKFRFPGCPHFDTRVEGLNTVVERERAMKTGIA